MPSVGVAIPSIPARPDMLARALSSVTIQTRLPDQISVVIDHDHRGAAPTRNRAWQALQTDWVAFMDDDDELLPHHLERLLGHAEETGADLVYPWFHLNQLRAGGFIRAESDGAGFLLVDGEDAEGRPFDEKAKTWILETGNFIPVTLIVRRSLLAEVGGFPTPGTEEWPHPTCEDWGCWQRLLRAGATFSHLPERTWIWRHHGRNTSGSGSRW